MGPNYDALSELGYRQARALGDHWAASGAAFDQIFAGPLQRHVQTAQCITAAYSDAGRALPPVQSLALLDEHHGVQVVAHVLGNAQHSLGARDAAPGLARADQEQLRREYFGQFREILLRWAGGELEIPGVESFASFRARASRVLARLATAGPGRVLAVSSGGLTAMMVGDLLGLGDEHVIDLNLIVRNCATTEFLASADRRRLLSFNALAPAVGAIGETFV